MGSFLNLGIMPKIRKNPLCYNTPNILMVREAIYVANDFSKGKVWQNIT